MNKLWQAEEFKHNEEPQVLHRFHSSHGDLNGGTGDEEQVQSEVPEHYLPKSAAFDHGGTFSPGVFPTRCIEQACTGAVGPAPQLLLRFGKYDEGDGHAQECQVGEEYGNKAECKVGHGDDEEVWEQAFSVHAFSITNALGKQYRVHLPQLMQIARSTAGAFWPFWLKAPTGQAATAGQRWFCGQRCLRIFNVLGVLSGPFRPKSDASVNDMESSKVLLVP